MERRHPLLRYSICILVCCLLFLSLLSFPSAGEQWEGDSYYTPLEVMPRLHAPSWSPPGCHPVFDPGLPQCIVGYGSLISEASKGETSKETSPNIPIELRGYLRSWNTRGFPVGRSTTFVGLRRTGDPSDAHTAVLYRVFDPSAELPASDSRERFYCRELVPPGSMHLLLGGDPDGNATLCLGGQSWVYVTRADSLSSPSVRFPIVQSYVDIVLSGALDLERRYQLEGFARGFLDTTSRWSSHWVNDRVFPRRPFVFVPDAVEIDTLLTEHPVTGQLYPCIPIE